MRNNRFLVSGGPYIWGRAVIGGHLGGAAGSVATLHGHDKV